MVYPVRKQIRMIQPAFCNWYAKLGLCDCEMWGGQEIYGGHTQARPPSPEKRERGNQLTSKRNVVILEFLFSRH